MNKNLKFVIDEKRNHPLLWKCFIFKKDPTFDVFILNLFVAVNGCINLLLSRGTLKFYYFVYSFLDKFVAKNSIL